ncbi:MAG: TA system VapC family ribonuclease toxin [Bryobacteraceae bacterium]
MEGYRSVPRGRGALLKANDLVLLDTNVLVALAWPNHPFHSCAIEFMRERRTWATCAITQLGFVRISMNPALAKTQIHCRQALDLLTEMVKDRGHRYLDGGPQPATDAVGFEHVTGHRQITDAYLVRLAASHGAMLATFDGGLKGMPGAIVVT